MNARLVQLSRIFGRELESDEAARRAIAEDPATLAMALFQEAADSDDVTSVATANEYLEGRLDYLAELLSHGGIERVRRAFAERVAAWERVP